MGTSATNPTPSQSKNERKYLREMGRRILLLATLVATATYAAGFTPPGGVWQESAGHLPGDPIIRSTHYMRYLLFFYCNATAFASSFMVVVLILVLLIARHQKDLRIIVIPLVLVTLLGLLSLIGAYAVGTFRDLFTVVFTSLLVGAVAAYLLLVYLFRDKGTNSSDAASASSPDPYEKRWNREVLMQLATFALTVTYGSGLSTPGGFWDSTDGGNRPGDAILKGAHPTAFFVCNTIAFVASLLMVLVLLLRKIRRIMAAYAGSILILFGLLGSYLAGSCRKNDTTMRVLASLIGAIVAYIIFLAVVTCYLWEENQDLRRLDSTTKIQAPSRDEDIIKQQERKEILKKTEKQEREEREELAYSEFVQFLATLALTITYVAGLHPPGGLWQDDGAGHKAGDPILQTTNLGRYKAFFYCNSIAFVASLVCMILVQLKPLLKHRALEQAMILDLLGLVGSYAFGSCRAETTTVYTMGIGGAALVYVVLHVVLLDDHKDTDGETKEDSMLRDDSRDDSEYKKWRKEVELLALDRTGYGFFVFAIFVATITYQAGLTPPGGFLLKDDESGNHAGDPVLLHNYPRRYRVFFYCNSTSFMVSIAVIILLVNQKLYRPAIKTGALSVCTAVSFFCLLAAFAAGTTQHLKTSIYILVLLAVVFFSAVLLILVFYLGPSISGLFAGSVMWLKNRLMVICWGWADTFKPTGSLGLTNTAGDATTSSEGDAIAVADRPTVRPDAKQRVHHAKRMYMMTVGILVASVTYQAGLDPPGGSWQGSSDGHNAGYPVMHNNRRQRYLAFFLSNSASFVASIFLMLFLLPKTNKYLKQRLPMLLGILMLGFLGLLVAYATGSNREWKTSVYVIAIFFSVLAYFGVLLVLSLVKQKNTHPPSEEHEELDAL